MRRTAAKACSAASSGSVDIKLCTAGKLGEAIDPAFQLTSAPLMMWAQAVNLADEPGEVPHSLLRRALALASRPAARSRSAGPARAMLTNQCRSPTPV